MPEKDVRSLEFLLEETLRLFQDCKSERKKLHEIEWEAGPDSPTILGEAEVRSGEVAGIVHTYLRVPEKVLANTESRYAILCKNSVYRSETLSTWMKNESSDYPGFAACVQAVEHLLWSMARILTAEALERESP